MEAWWNSLRRRVDVVAVEAMGEVFGEGGNRDAVRHLRDLDEVDQGAFQTAMDGLPPRARALVNDVSLPPFLADMQGLEQSQKRACEFFQDNALAFIIALLCKSLPECYAAARGAKVLARTGALGDPSRDRAGLEDTMVRRVMETAVFVQDVMNWSFWTAPSRPAIRTVQKVRLFHAGVRVLIERHGQRNGQPWNADADGDPINMQDTVGTLLAFSIQSVRGARRLGYRITKQQERDILLHWIVIGHHLGLDEDVLQQAWNDPYGLWERVCTGEFAFSPEGDALTTSLRDFLRNHVFVLQHRSFIPLTFMKRLMDPRALSALRLDRVESPSGILYSTVFTVILCAHGVLMTVPKLGKRITTWMGKELMEFMTNRWAGTNPAAITLENELRGV
jgi:hypothetical protein